MGEILITGIFVLSLGSLFVVVNSIDTPVDSTHLSIEEWIDIPSDTIYLHHIGGESIDTKDMNIKVIICGTDHVYSSANISENLGGKSFWELSDVIEINTSKEWGISILDEDDVIIKLINLDSKEILNPKYRISSSPKSSPSIDFEIKNGTIVPQSTFISSFKVLGAAIKSGETDLKVTTQLKIGNDTFDPWGDYNLAVTGNVNDNTTHSWSLPATYPANTLVSISGKSWNLDDSTPMHEVKSDTNSIFVKVLRNGDDVPPIPGLLDQKSISFYVDDYVEDSKIVLEENEAIFLFELGTPLYYTEAQLNNTSAADFQDLVILMEIDPAPA